MTAPVPTPAAELAVRLLDETRREVSQADVKAFGLLTVAGTTGAVAAGALTGAHWQPGRLSWPAEILWWTACAGWLFALLLLLAAVTPRQLRADWSPGHPIAYFGHIHRTGGGAALTAALAATAEDPMTGLAAELHAVSRIAVAKLRCVHAAVLAYVTAVLLLALAALIG
ncbi:Pycsar system effector family protein [Streptomyces purpureus]|uniref:Pycsar effector protein domain-containing protein n=1 Tax=Streptomyces purpureus TaxID=1951 RepID=A0A918H284_9ACTN|nr:Pycsar system effector family protein [Streptomyces purpureus]GGT34071.1 hypothetical protein GCM10014713_29820 [Streptomyces purpureus]